MIYGRADGHLMLLFITCGLDAHMDRGCVERNEVYDDTVSGALKAAAIEATCISKLAALPILCSKIPWTVIHKFHVTSYDYGKAVPGRRSEKPRLRERS
jgi:hypothetical protein